MAADRLQKNRINLRVPAMKVLILDDDDQLAEKIAEYLAYNGVCARLALNGDEFETSLDLELPDVAVLEVALAKVDGFQLLSKIRGKYGRLPILVLSKKAELKDRVLGLDLGADDYLCKPFASRELLARLNSLRRRGMPSTAGTTRHGALLLDHGRRQAALGDRDLELSAHEFEGLAALAMAIGQIMTRAQLARRLKGLAPEEGDRSIDVLISRLRQKLNDGARHPRFIKTVYSAGYLFLEQAQNPAETL
jgi:DNA-binding response OmpR family regulator